MKHLEERQLFRLVDEPRSDPCGFHRALRELGWDCGTLLVAERFAARLLGLMSLSARSLAEDVAVGFPRCRSVHTFFMGGPVDVAFIDGRGTVLSVYCSVAPWRVLYCPSACSVLERFAGGE